MYVIKYLYDFLVFCILLSNTNRFYGNLNNLSQTPLQIMSFVFAFLNGSFRFIWGFLFDKFNFKILMSINFCIQIIVSISISFIALNVYVYILENWLIAICLSGCFTLLPPIFNKTFGMKNGASIFGFSGVLCGLSSFLGPVISKLFLKEKIHYMILYISSSSLSIICLATVFFFKEEAFRIQEK